MTAVVPGFLSKLYEIFSSEEFDDCCKWGAKGESIVVFQLDTFSKKVLPKYFKHQNFQSFVRQLNNYDFRKNTQDPNLAEFHHPYFKKDKPELMTQIKRKSLHKKDLGHAHTAESGENHPVFHPSIIGESDELLYELNYQRILHDEFEKKIETKFAKLEGENAMFKQLFLESLNKNTIMQERMERVLKTIFHVYTSSTGNPAVLGTSTNPGAMIQDWQKFQADLQRQGSNGQLVPRGSNSGYPFDSQQMQQAVAGALLGGGVGGNGVGGAGGILGGEMAPSRDSMFNGLNQQYPLQVPLSTSGGIASVGPGSDLSLANPNDEGRFERMSTTDLINFAMPMEDTPRVPHGVDSDDDVDAHASLLARSNKLAGMALSRDNTMNSFDRAASSVEMPTSRHLNAYNSALFDPSGPKRPLSLDPVANFDGQELFRMESLVGSPTGVAISEEEPDGEETVGSSSRIAPASVAADPNEIVSGLKRGIAEVDGAGFTENQSAEFSASAGQEIKKVKNAEEEEEDDEENVNDFLHLLERNQNSTLTRLSSLEESIASILNTHYDSDSGSVDPETGSHRATPAVESPTKVTIKTEMDGNHTEVHAKGT